MSIKLKFKYGVLNGDEVYELFKIAKKNKFALPAINCNSIDVINAALETAKIVNSPIIIQLSYNGSIFMSGSGILSKDTNKLACLGSILAAKHVHKVAEYYNIPIILSTDHCTKKNLLWIDNLIEFNEKHYIKNKRPLFSIHMIDLSKENIENNIYISMKYLSRISKINTMLEIEIGKVNNVESLNKNNNLTYSYTKKRDIFFAYEKLKNIDKKFIIAISFGNIHGIASKSTKLFPRILYSLQKYISRKFHVPNNSLNLVFHGGSGVSYKDIKRSINYGIVKINLDTDINLSIWNGILKYCKMNNNLLNNHEYTIKENKLNKNFYNYRSWMRFIQLSIKERLIKSFKDFNSLNVLDKYL